MTNVELKEKIEEIIAIGDYFDRTIAISNFEKEYKTSEFFKITKKDLNELIKEYRINILLSPQELGKKLQETFSNLDLSNLNELLDKMGETFGKENSEIIEALKDLKDITSK